MFLKPWSVLGIVANLYPQDMIIHQPYRTEETMLIHISSRDYKCQTKCSFKKSTLNNARYKVVELIDDTSKEG
ncbi:hypothetical protein A0J61_03272 [Choanephora cucurbitarum]|uniref:Uncharacterized protein n=1 Tax=Choanephora cucurbitarum TaxID=101091 RepID=A0A1C7NN33_9FUNG|nr:hypothetical protein A0J61_03272 [Choanephora cucurbitarum]